MSTDNIPANPSLPASSSSSASEIHEGGKWPLPYYAVIFTSQRHAPAASSTTTSSSSSSSKVDDDYSATAAAMFALAQQQPGYLGVDSHHTLHQDGSVEGVTVSYWTDRASIRAWRAVTEHAEARRRGKAEWYKAWNVRVAKVEREYCSSGGLDSL